ALTSLGVPGGLRVVGRVLLVVLRLLQLRLALRTGLLGPVGHRLRLVGRVQPLVLQVFAGLPELRQLVARVVGCRLMRSPLRLDGRTLGGAALVPLPGQIVGPVLVVCPLPVDRDRTLIRVLAVGPELFGALLGRLRLRLLVLLALVQRVGVVPGLLRPI